MEIKDLTIENEQEVAEKFIEENPSKALLVSGFDGRSSSRLYGISEIFLYNNIEGTLYGLISTNTMTGALPLILKKETLIEDIIIEYKEDPIEIEPDFLDVFDRLTLDQAEDIVVERLAKIVGKELIKVEVRYFEPGEKI